MQSTSIWHTDSPIPLGANSAPDKIDMDMVQSSMFQLRSSICDWIAITWCRPGTQRDETSLCLVCTGRRFQMLHTSHNRHRHRSPPLDDTDQAPKYVIPSCWDARTQSGVHVICTASSIGPSEVIGTRSWAGQLLPLSANHKIRAIRGQ